mmetsp:Transcript_123/g.380  ORF Transcript_123/g.380 Transcript_123/m.380 type:complete len:266 (+) Transcript_123:3-800(+)
MTLAQSPRSAPQSSLPVNHAGDMSWRELEGMRRLSAFSSGEGSRPPEGPVMASTAASHSRLSAVRVDAGNIIEASQRLSNLKDSLFSPQAGTSAAIAGYGPRSNVGAIRTASERVSNKTASDTPGNYGTLVPTVCQHMPGMPGWHKTLFEEYKDSTPEQQLDAYVMHKNSPRYQTSVVERARNSKSQPWVKWTTDELLSLPSSRRAAPSPAQTSASYARTIAAISPSLRSQYRPSEPRFPAPYATGYGFGPSTKEEDSASQGLGP